MYELHCNYGFAIFESEKDTISAVQLIGLYHEIHINREEVKRSLEEKSYFEAFPLAIIKSN